MSAFTYIPDQTARLSNKPNVKKIQFGDGYVQDQPQGINANPQSWALTFSNRDLTEAAAIDSFFRNLGGSQQFQWIPPGESSPRNFVCPNWEESEYKPATRTITATIDERFDP